MAKEKISVRIETDTLEQVKDYATKNRYILSLAINKLLFDALNPAPTLTRSQVEFSIKKSRKTAQS